MAMERSISGFGTVTPDMIVHVARNFSTPCYFCDGPVIENQCEEALAMPNPYGISVRYAMKANSTRAILQLIHGKKLKLDSSSLNEVRRAYMAGIPYEDTMLTSQEVQAGEDLEDTKEMMKEGLRYNHCSLRQMISIGPFAAKKKLPTSIRIHPGVGSGESSTRNTGDKYSCFGIHLTDLPAALNYAHDNRIEIDQVHVHIGSGGDPKKWRENIDRELGFVERYFIRGKHRFPIKTVSFGGGLKVARMPDETAADIEDLGDYASRRIEQFYKRNRIKLKMEIEPGTFIVANSGYVITKIEDIKKTGKDGFTFIVLNGGMEVNTRPLLYGSRHPFYLISKSGNLISSEFDIQNMRTMRENLIVVGRVCESGDSFTLDEHGHITTRLMGSPCVGDYLVIGGAGAYCSSMSPFNYNSHLQVPEILLYNDKIKLIRKKQTLEQLVQNERSLR